MRHFRSFNQFYLHAFPKYYHVNNLNKYDNIRNINNMSYRDKIYKISYNSDFLLKHLDLLNIQTIACAISNCKDFAKGFANQIVDNDRLDLYHNTVKYHRSIAFHILKNVDNETNIKLSNYLFHNLSSIIDIPDVVTYSIINSQTFLLKLTDLILNKDFNLKIINRLDYLSIYWLLEYSTNDNKLQIFYHLINNISKLQSNVIMAGLGVYYELKDGITFVKNVSKYIFITKNIKLLRSLNDLSYFVADDNIKQELFTFVIDNFDCIISTSTNIIYNLVKIDDKFRILLIDHLYSKKIILTCDNDILRYLYKVPTPYKQKLEDIIFVQYDKLQLKDILIITKYWDIDFVKKITKKIVSTKRNDLIHEMLCFLEARDKNFVIEVIKDMDIF